MAELHDNGMPCRACQGTKASRAGLPAPSDCKGLFSEDGEVMKLHTQGSRMIPKPGNKHYIVTNYGIIIIAQARYAGSGGEEGARRA